MEGFVVSAVTGALKPVLEKLADLLGSEYKRFKHVRREIQFLIDELEPMHAFLLKMSEKENPDAQEKAWTKEVREMSYDIEDCIHDFMLHVDGNGGGNFVVTPKGLVDRCKDLMRKAKARQSVAKVVQDLKNKIKGVADRNVRYRIHEAATAMKTSNCTEDDPRALAMFKHASKLKGIDGPKQEFNRSCRSSLLWESEVWEKQPLRAMYTKS